MYLNPRKIRKSILRYTGRGFSKINDKEQAIDSKISEKTKQEKCLPGGEKITQIYHIQIYRLKVKKILEGSQRKETLYIEEKIRNQKTSRVKLPKLEDNDINKLVKGEKRYKLSSHNPEFYHHQDTHRLKIKDERKHIL